MSHAKVGNLGSIHSLQSAFTQQTANGRSIHSSQNDLNSVNSESVQSD